MRYNNFIYKQFEERFARRSVFISRTRKTRQRYDDTLSRYLTLGAIAKTTPTKFLGEHDLENPIQVAQDVSKDIRILIFTYLMKWNPENIQAILDLCPNVNICIQSHIPLDEVEISQFPALYAREEDPWQRFFDESGIELEKQELNMLKSKLLSLAEVSLSPVIVNRLDNNYEGIISSYENIMALADETGIRFIDFMRSKAPYGHNLPYDEMFEDYSVYKTPSGYNSSHENVNLKIFKKWVGEYAKVARYNLVESITDDDETFRFVPMRLM